MRATSRKDGEPTEAPRARLRRRRLLLAGFAVVAMAVGAYTLGPRTSEPPLKRPVVVAPRTPEPPVTWPPPDDRVAQAVGRCQATWQARERALVAEPGNVQTLDAQADCGMVLVAHARLTGNEARFRDVVDPITPVLSQALETAGGARAADLLAHLGWPTSCGRGTASVGCAESFYRRAIEQDPANPYANAMWGHWILWRHGSLAEAQARFQLARGREREYVRWLQIVALLLFSDAPLEFEAVRVANEMRGSGEPVPTNDAERWSGASIGTSTTANSLAARRRRPSWPSCLPLSTWRLSAGSSPRARCLLTSCTCGCSSWRRSRS